MRNQNISGGAALAAAKKSKKNLFILISNTYNGTIQELPGIRKDRENIIKEFGWGKSDYGKLFSQDYINVEFNKDTKSSVKKLVETTNLASLTRVSKAKDLLRFCLLTNCKKTELIQNINLIKQKYDYSNIILCITGHGMNSAGIISFLTEDNKIIKLSDIVMLLNTDNLLNMTILLDTCRSGEYVDEKAAHELLSNSISKRVVVMTAGWRGQSASDTRNGGYLIQALAKTINENYDLFVLSLLSFEYTLKLVTDIVSDYLYIRLNKIEGMDIREWIRIVNNKDPKYLKQIKICKKLTSVYLNSRAREYLERLPKRLDKFKRILLPLLCRNYEDIYLSVAAAGTKPTKIKVKR